MNKFNIIIVGDPSPVQQSLNKSLDSDWQLYYQHDQDLPQVSKSYHLGFISLDTEPSKGLTAMLQLKKINPYIELIAFSKAATTSLMEAALKAGAHKFLSWPLNEQEVWQILIKTRYLMKLRDSSLKSTHPWIGSSPASEQVKRQVAHFHNEPGPILITGETGTGKEVVARNLHHNHKNPFVAINVATLPDNLFEAELFGYTRGAFTGADSSRLGLAEVAEGGDLFLDEIETLSLSNQAKLLRFIESSEIRALGSTQTRRINTRIIVASNKKLEPLLEQGHFREDLYWRFKGKDIDLPPLRQRKAEIVELAHFFLSKTSSPKTLTTKALHQLENYSWPGNVRELQKVCEQLVNQAPLPIIRDHDVNTFLIRTRINHNLFLKSGINKNLSSILDEFEAQIIAKFLNEYDDIEKTAQHLKISRSSLYKKIKDYEIQWGS